MPLTCLLCTYIPSQACQVGVTYTHCHAHTDIRSYLQSVLKGKSKNKQTKKNIQTTTTTKNISLPSLRKSNAICCLQWATAIRRPAVTPHYDLHQKANGWWGRAAMGGSEPSLLTPDSGILGLKRQTTIQCQSLQHYSLFSCLPCGLQLHCRMSSAHLLTRSTPITCSLASCPAHSIPFLQDPGRQLGSWALLEQE